VQVLAGVLLPSAAVFLLLLCNDKAVLGPWVNGRWRNLATGAIVALLVVLSLVLTAAVVFPDLTDAQIIAVMVAGAVLGAIGFGATRLVAPAVPERADGPVPDRATWRMPPLDRLPPPCLSLPTRLWMGVLRVYLAAAVVLVVCKLAALALAGGGS
ncbi:MAG: hypothetical protein ACREFY_12940, partial [Acetobacteraceae bacterium]